jgi:hypothetical protein
MIDLIRHCGVALDQTDPRGQLRAEACKRMEQRQPIERMRTLEEIAGLAVYLAAGLLFMIGSNVVIEGGATVG